MMSVPWLGKAVFFVLQLGVTADGEDEADSLIQEAEGSENEGSDDDDDILSF